MTGNNISKVNTYVMLARLFSMKNRWFERYLPLGTQERVWMEWFCVERETEFRFFGYGTDPLGGGGHPFLTRNSCMDMNTVTPQK